jgi:hypothetical protein
MDPHMMDVGSPAGYYKYKSPRLHLLEVCGAPGGRFGASSSSSSLHFQLRPACACIVEA